jgi:hypothetical protein
MKIIKDRVVNNEKENVMKKNILKEKDLAALILNRLSEHAEIPSKGFLAGGAVANTILTLEYGGDYPINDMDIFQVTRFAPLEHGKMPHRHVAKTLFYTGYFGVGCYNDPERGYTVLETKRDGLVNTINVQLTKGFGSKEDYEMILKGFALNCCQAGIDLESKEFICAPTFASFLETMQLKVHYPWTPFHTAIRLPKKQKELKCYCNYPTETKYLSQIPLVLLPRDREEEYPPFEFARYFGEKSYHDYLLHKEEIDKYFEVIDHNKRLADGSTVCLHTMIPRDLEIVEELKECLSLISLKQTWDLLQGRKGDVEKNRRALSRDGWAPKTFLMVNPDYAQCD